MNVSVSTTTSAVDYVLITHMHADNVGWNTRAQAAHRQSLSTAFGVPSFKLYLLRQSDRLWPSCVCIDAIRRQFSVGYKFNAPGWVLNDHKIFDFVSDKKWVIADDDSRSQILAFNIPSQSGMDPIHPFGDQ